MNTEDMSFVLQSQSPSSFHQSTRTTPQEAKDVQSLMWILIPGRDSLDGYNEYGILVIPFRKVLFLQLFAGRLLPVVLFVCCVLASTAFYNHDVARQLDNRPQTTISVLRDTDVVKQISPFVQVQVDSANSNFKTVSGILWNKSAGTVVTKYRLIKVWSSINVDAEIGVLQDTKSLSILDPTRGRVDLSVLAVDEKGDIAILEISHERKVYNALQECNTTHIND